MKRAAEAVLTGDESAAEEGKKQKQHTFFLDFDGTITAHHTWVCGRDTDAQVDVPAEDENVKRYFGGEPRLAALRRLLNTLEATATVVILTRSPAATVRVWMQRAGLPAPDKIVGREEVNQQYFGKADVVAKTLKEQPAGRVGFVDDSSGEVSLVCLTAMSQKVSDRLYPFSAADKKFCSVSPRDARNVVDIEELRRTAAPEGEGAGLKEVHMDQLLADWAVFINRV